MNPADEVLERYLATRGIDVTALQEASNRAYTQSWAEATQEFLSQNPSYEGGEQNMRQIGERVIALGLEESPEKAKALSRAYAELKTEGLIVPNPEAERLAEFNRMIAEAKDSTDIKRATEFYRGF
jgi:hypothetical protein